MSDNIFNYFSSKGTRKVDPIDDAEFDSIDAPTTPSDPPSPAAIQDSAKEVVASDVGSAGMAGQGSHTAPLRSPESSEFSSMDKPPKKSQSHWDYLASLLGIKKESTADASEDSVIPAPSKTQERPAVSASHEHTKPKSASRSAPAPQVPVKEAAIMNSLFVAGSSASESAVGSELAVAGVQSPNDPESSDVAPDGEYVEFEVEDLDKSGEGDDTERKSRRSFSRPGPRQDQGRSRDDSRRGSERDRQPSRPRQDPRRNSNDSGTSADAETHSRERQVRVPRGRQDRDPQSRDPQSRDPQSRDPQSRDPQSRDPQSRERQSRDPQSRERQSRERQVGDEPNQSVQKRRDHGPESDRSLGKEHRPERGSFRSAPAAQSRADDSFGSGVFEDSPEKSEARFEEDAPRRKRRRRRSHDSSSREPGPSSLPRHSPLPEVDPPDEFFDEVGWQPAQPQRHARPEAVERSIEDAFEGEDLDFPVAQEGESDQGERTVRKRRRRRPRGRRGSTNSDSTNAATDNNFEDRTEVSQDHLDDEKDEFDYDQAHRKPRQQRQPAAPGRTADRNVDNENHSPSETPKRDRKFPTWEEAISVLVESNIKNHSRSSGQNRSGGNRGRRRR